MTCYRESPGVCCKRAHQSQLLGGEEDLGHLFSESESHSVISNSLWPHGLYSPWNSLGQNIGVGSLSFLLGTLPNPGIEPRSPTLQVDSLPAEPQGKPSCLFKSHAIRLGFSGVSCAQHSTWYLDGEVLVRWNVWTAMSSASRVSQLRVGFQLKGTQSVLLRLALVITFCPLPSSSNLFQLRPAPLWGSCSLFQ